MDGYLSVLFLLAKTHSHTKTLGKCMNSSPLAMGKY